MDRRSCGKHGENCEKKKAVGHEPKNKLKLLLSSALIALAYVTVSEVIGKWSPAGAGYD